MKTIEEIWAQQQKELDNDKEMQLKIKNSSDKELLDWLGDLATYGELLPLESAVHSEALSRGGETAEKADWIWNNI